MLDQTLWKTMFCAIFDLNNYRYCDIRLWTKYTHGIVQHMSIGIPSIQVGEWQCKMELCDIHPYQSVRQLKFCLNKKWHEMDSSPLKVNETLRSPLPKSMASHQTLV